MKIFIMILFTFISSQAISENSFYYKKIDVNNNDAHDEPHKMEFNDSDYTWVFNNTFNRQGALDISIYTPGEESLGDVYHVSFQLQGPEGGFTGPGAYKLERYPFQHKAKAGSDSNFEFCNENVGEVEVFEIEYDSQGHIASIAADWEMSCRASYKVNEYKLRYNSDLPLHLPQAHAMTNRVIDVTEPKEIYLDGSASYSDNGEIIKYEWKQVYGQTLEIANMNSSVASINIPTTDSLQIYKFELKITDTSGKVDSSTVMV